MPVGAVILYREYKSNNGVDCYEFNYDKIKIRGRQPLLDDGPIKFDDVFELIE